MGGYYDCSSTFCNVCIDYLFNKISQAASDMLDKTPEMLPVLKKAGVVDAGGKGFLVALSTLWAVDLRVGAICTAVMVVLLLITHYMSLSTVSSLLIAPVIMALFGASPLPIAFVAVFVIFTAVRHRENFKRLISGTESKFYLRGKKAE